MTTAKRFEDLEVWQTARAVTKFVYELTDNQSFSRDFGLRDQMRRASVSVMSNIAEGFESQTTRMFLQFLGRAKGSAGELRTQSYAALDVGHITPDQFNQIRQTTTKLSRQLATLMAYLETSKNTFRVRENSPSDGSGYEVS